MTDETKVEQAEEVKPAPEAEAPAPVATEPKKKGSPLKIIALVGGMVFLIILLVLGYGFWNGSQIRKYATDSETLYAVTKDWNDAFDDTDTDKVKENVTEIKTESDKALTTLNGKAAPSKAKKLKADMVEYFTVSKKVATDAEGIIDWVIEIEKTTEDFSSLSALNTSSPEAMVTSIDKAKTDVDASIVKLKKIAVPASLQKQHDAYVKMLEDMSVMYGKLATALRANDLDALTTISSEFTTSATALDSVEDPEKSITDSYKAESDKLDSLEKSINDEIGKLKGTGFSF